MPWLRLTPYFLGGTTTSMLIIIAFCHYPCKILNTDLRTGPAEGTTEVASHGTETSLMKTRQASVGREPCVINRCYLGTPTHGVIDSRDHRSARLNLSHIFTENPGASKIVRNKVYCAVVIGTFMLLLLILILMLFRFTCSALCPRAP